MVTCAFIVTGSSVFAAGTSGQTENTDAGAPPYQAVAAANKTAAGSKKPATDAKKPAADTRKPAADSKSLAADNKDLAADSKEPAADTQKIIAGGANETPAEKTETPLPKNEFKPDPSLRADSLLLENDILAFYGHPNSKNMGILGRHTKAELLERLNTFAADYKAVSSGRNIIKAFYIIYGTCWPEGEIGVINRNQLQEYIDFAAENGMLVFLDHQIGKYDPIKSLQRMLPYLKYPNVHLALDPEWRTTKPMREIGSVTAAEINEAQRVMQEYITENNIQGERMLVIHQFNAVMIKNRAAVKADKDQVRLLLCMDGHGTPVKKRGTYAFNAEATNIPIKGFKLFLNEKGNTGIDEPLLSPAQVYALNPRPYLIMYQ